MTRATPPRLAQRYLGEPLPSHRAQEILRQGQEHLESGAWRPAKRAFREATSISPTCAQMAVDCYDAVGDGAQKRKDAALCHREAKRYCKRICHDVGDAPEVPPAWVGQSWHALGAQYAKTVTRQSVQRARHQPCSSLFFTGHCSTWTMSTSRQATAGDWMPPTHGWHTAPEKVGLETSANKPSEAPKLGKMHGRCWQAPVWSDASYKLWEAVADLAMLCSDRPCVDIIVQRILPLLEASTGAASKRAWTRPIPLLPRWRC